MKVPAIHVFEVAVVGTQVWAWNVAKGFLCLQKAQPELMGSSQQPQSSQA